MVVSLRISASENGAVGVLLACVDACADSARRAGHAGDARGPGVIC